MTAGADMLGYGVCKEQGRVRKECAEKTSTERHFGGLRLMRACAEVKRRFATDGEEQVKREEKREDLWVAHVGHSKAGAVGEEKRDDGKVDDEAAVEEGRKERRSRRRHGSCFEDAVGCSLLRVSVSHSVEKDTDDSTSRRASEEEMKT